MIELSLFNKIYKLHAQKLKNLNISNKRLVICFSGVPASGKTSLAMILEKKYNAVRINKDEIGNLINKIKTITTKEKEELADKYIIHLFNNWIFKNNLIILDKSIDRKYKEIFDILKNNKFQKFIIRLNISKSVALKRIKERNKENLHEWLEKVDKWFKDFEDSGKNIQPDFIYNNKQDLRELFKKLEYSLSNLN